MLSASTPLRSGACTLTRVLLRRCLLLLPAPMRPDVPLIAARVAGLAGCSWATALPRVGAAAPTLLPPLRITADIISPHNRLKDV